jgi:hypothetical protein
MTLTSSEVLAKENPGIDFIHAFIAKGPSLLDTLMLRLEYLGQTDPVANDFNSDGASS